MTTATATSFPALPDGGRFRRRCKPRPMTLSRGARDRLPRKHRFPRVVLRYTSDGTLTQENL